MNTRKAYRIGERPKEQREDKRMLMGNLVPCNTNIDVLLTNVVLNHGATILEGKITVKGEFESLPLALQNALVELVEEWGYEVIFETEPPLDL